MKEEWKNIVVSGKICQWYSVSNYGNIMLHVKKNVLRNKLTNKLQGCYSEYIPSYSKNKNLRIKTNPDGTPRYVYVKLGFPLDFFDDTDIRDQIKQSINFSEYKQKRKNIERELKVHKLVMDAFKPIELFPPEEIKNYWSLTPEAIKQWIKGAVCINHIDHNPCNNHVSNLEYTNTIDNSYKAIRFYGGSFNNKKVVLNG